MALRFPEAGGDDVMPDSDPTPDETAGMNWWRHLSETEQAYWLEIARASTAKSLPADAWEAFKRVTARAVCRPQ
jgi:hypothetical protein